MSVDDLKSKEIPKNLQIKTWLMQIAIPLARLV